MSLGTALVGAVHGTLADRFGQRSVVALAAIASTAAMVAVVLASARGAPQAATSVAASGAHETTGPSAKALT